MFRETLVTMRTIRVATGTGVRRCAGAAALLLAVAGPAGAQSHAAIGLGGSLSVRVPSDPMASHTAGLGPLIRLRTGSGLGPAIGFEWFRTGLDTTLTGDRRRLGTLQVRPVMAGVGYGLLREPWEVSVSLIAGYAFASLRENDMTRAAYRDGVEGSFVTIDTKGSPAWRAKLALWHDLSPRVGLTVGVAYLNVHPTIDLVTDRGRDRVRVRASPVVLSAGVVYGVF